LSVGWGVVVIIGFWGPPDHVSALSSPGTWPGIRPVIHAYQQEGADRLGMVSRCVSAAGVRFLVILFPLRELSSPYGRPTASRSRGGP
jgi:hypothetical protein